MRWITRSWSPPAVPQRRYTSLAAERRACAPRRSNGFTLAGGAPTDELLHQRHPERPHSPADSELAGGHIGESITPWPPDQPLPRSVAASRRWWFEPDSARAVPAERPYVRLCPTIRRQP